MSNAPRDDDKGIWTRIFDGFKDGLWFVLKASTLIGLFVWVQNHPVEARALVDTVVQFGADVFHWIAANVKPEDTPNVH